MRKIQTGLMLCIGLIVLKPSLALAVNSDATGNSLLETASFNSSTNCHPNHYHASGTFAIDISCDGITTHKRDQSSFSKLLIPIFIIIGIGRLLYGKFRSED